MSDVPLEGAPVEQSVDDAPIDSAPESTTVEANNPSVNDTITIDPPIESFDDKIVRLARELYEILKDGTTEAGFWAKQESSYLMNVLDHFFKNRTK